MAPFVAAYADSGMGRERRKQDDAATAAEDRQELLHKEEGCPDVDGEEIVEILNRIVFDRCGLGDAGIGDEDIQTIAHDGADLLGELVRPIRRARSAATVLARPPALRISATTASASFAPRP
jgi:hypothetical protein